MDLSDNNHVSSTIHFNEPNYENGQPEQQKHGNFFLFVKFGEKNQFLNR